MSGNIFCQIGTDTQPIPAGTSREPCIEAGGTVIETSNPSGFHSGIGCFVRDVLTRSLGEQILNLGGTYLLAVQVRDKILAPTPFGKQMLEHYYEYLGEIYKVVANDPELLAHAILVWGSVWQFASNVLSTANAIDSGERPPRNRNKFSPQKHRKIIRLVEKLKKGTLDPKFKVVLDEFKQEIGRYVGLSPEEFLMVLRRER